MAGFDSPVRPGGKEPEFTKPTTYGPRRFPEHAILRERPRVNIRVNIRENVRPRENDIEGNARPTRLQPMREKSTHISDPSGG